MIKISTADKIVIVISVLNLLSFAIGSIFYNMLYEDNSILYEIIVVNNFYILFGVPLSVFAGIMVNITSVIEKVKFKRKIKMNIILFALLLLMAVGWQHFIWQALMGV